MAKKIFTPAERYAVYTTHGEKCYLCTRPVDLASMQVDHIIPESLLDEPDRLAEVLDKFRLPREFDLNSYANWMPSCSQCNNGSKPKMGCLEMQKMIRLPAMAAGRNNLAGPHGGWTHHEGTHGRQESYGSHRHRPDRRGDPAAIADGAQGLAAKTGTKPQ